MKPSNPSTIERIQNDHPLAYLAWFTVQKALLEQTKMLTGSYSSPEDEIKVNSVEVDARVQAMFLEEKGVGYTKYLVT